MEFLSNPVLVLHSTKPQISLHSLHSRMACSRLFLLWAMPRVCIITCIKRLCNGIYCLSKHHQCPFHRHSTNKSHTQKLSVQETSILSKFQCLKTCTYLNIMASMWVHFFSVSKTSSHLVEGQTCKHNNHTISASETIGQPRCSPLARNQCKNMGATVSKANSTDPC